MKPTKIVSMQVFREGEGDLFIYVATEDGRVFKGCHTYDYTDFTWKEFPRVPLELAPEEVTQVL
jgi:hypothetical protein